MPTAPDDIVLTGFGVVTPIGTGVDAFWDSLLHQRGAVELMEPHQGAAGRYWMAGIVRGFDPRAYIQPRKSLKLMCVETQMAFAASVMACRQSGIQPGLINPDRLGTVFGSEMLYSDIDELKIVVDICRRGGEMQFGEWGRTAMQQINPLWLLRSLPNMAACHVGIWIDARGPNNTLTCDETSSVAAIIEASQVIRRGQADCMLVGAAGSRISLTRMIQREEIHYSKAYRDPVSACKPYDERRDGAVSGTGAAAIVLERRSHAEARGAPIIARLMSWSSTFGRASDPRGGSASAVASSIAQALERAKVEVDALDHINASAKGMRYFDANEAQGIAEAAGQTPVTAIKGFVGDTGASNGLIELCASLAGIRDQIVPATLNHQRTARDCPIEVVHGEHRRWTKPYFIKTSMTPHGQAASILLSIDEAA